jgi:hypothetical protein
LKIHLGPFFDERLLQWWMNETTLRLGAFASIFAVMADENPRLESIAARFHSQLEAWVGENRKDIEPPHGDAV